jgi:hypothetical protein
VSSVVSTTQAHTIALAGMSFTYASPPEEEVAANDTKPAKPKVGFGNKNKTAEASEVAGGEEKALPKVRRMN